MEKSTLHCKESYSYLQAIRLHFYKVYKYLDEIKFQCTFVKTICPFLVTTILILTRECVLVVRTKLFMSLVEHLLIYFTFQQETPLQK